MRRHQPRPEAGQRPVGAGQLRRRRLCSPRGAGPPPGWAGQPRRRRHPAPAAGAHAAAPARGLVGGVFPPSAGVADSSSAWPLPTEGPSAEAAPVAEATAPVGARESRLGAGAGVALGQPQEAAAECGWGAPRALDGSPGVA